MSQQPDVIDFLSVKVESVKVESVKVESTQNPTKELELTVRNTPKITDDNYFKDVTSEISEHDRAKAGYKVPKVTISAEEFLKKNKIDSLDVIGRNHNYVASGEKVIMGPQKPMSTKTLAGDLTNQPVHLPMNYFDGPSLFPSNSVSHQSELKQGSIVKMNVGGDNILVAKGPNNEHGQEGFSVGIFNAGKFGSFPSADQTMTYNAHNALTEDSIKLSQIDPEELKKNAHILAADYSSKTLPDISTTGQTLSEALIQITEEPILESHQSVIPYDTEHPLNELKLKIEEQDKMIHDLVSSVQSLSSSVKELTQQVTLLTKVIDEKKTEGVLWTLYNKVAWWRD
jgi:hypothetical protein